MKNIQSRYEKTKDLQASFTKTRIEGFSTPVISTGHFYIKKPGKLRWDYIEPATEEIYVNKDDVKMYVPEHKQVLVGKLTYMAASQAPLQLLQGWLSWMRNSTSSRCRTRSGEPGAFSWSDAEARDVPNRSGRFRKLSSRCSPRRISSRPSRPRGQRQCGDV